MPCTCKGFNPLDHKTPLCPSCAKKHVLQSIPLKKDFSAQSPSPFIGSYNYPNVSIGVLAPPEIPNPIEHDHPTLWAQKNYQIPKIIQLRSQLVNTKTTKKDKLLEVAQQVAMAKNPADIEVNLKNKPSINFSTDHTTPPYGPQGILKSIQLTSNPKIPTKIEKVTSDDLKAVQAMTYLYNNNIDTNKIQKLLSTATLGLKPRLVPTRWSITATDDTISKDIIKQLHDYELADYELYQGSYLGNYYYFLFFPHPWAYELFETVDGINYNTDYEKTKRTNYAQSTAGGYYSVRFAIAQHLKRIKRQAAVLAIRIITKEYSTPLGVWVTREAAKKALDSQKMNFSQSKLLVDYTTINVKKRLNLNINTIFRKSRIIKEILQQTKLSAFH